MPVRRTTTSRNGQRKPAYSAGLGKAYTFNPDNPASRGAAKQRAERQQRARYARERRQGRR